MSNYIISRKALKDLEIIWNYTYDTWSEEQTDKCGRHIIFYKILKNGKVRILRILHDSMDFGRHF